MKRVAVFTGTRAEYGLLYWLMKEIQASDTLDLQIIVSAMHLSPEFGETWRKIEADGFHIDAKVEMLLSSNTPVGVVKSIGLGTIGYADALDRLRPDWLVVLGDRFEALAIAQAALIMKIPIAHIHGGEITEGAYDDAIRHAITKMASLHFTATESYRQRVIQMGEQPDIVFSFGAPGLEHIRRSVPSDLARISASLGLQIRGPYVIATYHPVTAGDEDPCETASAMLASLDAFPDYQVIATYPNADNGGREIIAILETHAQAHPGKMLVVPSLGMERYISLLRGASAVVGNSSSGIIEAPSLGVPSVNIGVRQKGRLAAASVLHSPIAADAIKSALLQALSADFQHMARSVHNPYEGGNVAAKMAEALATIEPAQAKRFNDFGTN